MKDALIGVAVGILGISSGFVLGSAVVREIKAMALPPAPPPSTLSVDTLRVRVLVLDSVTIGGKPVVLFGYREGGR